MPNIYTIPLNSYQLPAASHQGGFFVVMICGDKEMMYEKVLKDYSKRALENYEKNINTENDVTLLICSFTGVMAMIDKKMRKLFFKNVAYENITQIVNPIKNEPYNGIDENNQTLALYRHFRNALCHIKLEEHITADENDEIASIKFEDYWDKKLQFDCILTIQQLAEFFKFTVDIIQKNKGIL